MSNLQIACPLLRALAVNLFVTSGAAIDYGRRYIQSVSIRARETFCAPPRIAQLFRHIRWPTREIPNVAQNLLRCRFEVAPLSLRHRSVVAALSLHYRRAIECLLRLPVYECVSGLQMFEIAKLMVKHYPRQSYDFTSSRGQLHQVDLYY